MIASMIPFIAIQVIGHAQKISTPNADARDCCNRLQKDLKQFTLRKTRETRSQVVFTVQDDRRVINIIVSSVAGEEQSSSGDTLYLNFSSARLIWHYVAQQQGA